MTDGDQYLNEYICYRCDGAWEQIDEACPDDDCPHCGARHASPHSSVLIQELDAEIAPYIVDGKPAGHPPISDADE
jgi:hypothetical protein